MHIPDGFLDPKMSSGLLGMAVGVLGYCAAQVMKAVTAVVPRQVLATAGNFLGSMQMGGRRIVSKIGKEKLQQMGMVAAWVFSAQMLSFPVGSGTSGHLVGGIFSAVLLGPFAGTVVMAVVVTVQSLFFADGGIQSLGANVFNMAVLGSLASYYVYAGLRKVLPETAGVAAAAWFSVMLAAVACAVEIGVSGTVGLAAVTTAMVKTYSLIGVAEAVITVALLRYFEKSGQA